MSSMALNSYCRRLVAGGLAGLLSIVALTGTCFLPAPRLAAQEAAAEDALPRMDWKELAVSPRAIEQPWLELHLLPDRSRMLEGNAVPILLRQAWERPGDYWQRASKADDYLNVPLKELDVERLEADVPKPPVSELRRAAYRTYAHWEYPLRETDEPHAILLPDTQGMRALCRMLAAYCRADIVGQRVEPALDKITIGLGVAQHVASAPFLVSKLVAMVNMHMMFDRLEELISLPSAPNFYWSLTMMPELTMELRECIDWERKLINTTIPEGNGEGFDWRAAAERQALLIQSSLNDFPARIERLGGHKAAQAKFVARARERLPQLQPDQADRVATMSDEEAAVRYFALEYTRVSDRALASLAVGPHEGLAFVRRLAEERDQQTKDDLDLQELTLSPLLVIRTTWAMQRRIAALRTIELLRDHAARHEGKLPDTLEQMKDFPLPLDPVTQQPVHYRLKGKEAYLWVPPVLENGAESRVVAYSIRLK